MQSKYQKACEDFRSLDIRIKEKGGEEMRRRRKGMCLLLALVLATGSMVAVQAAADGTTTQARDVEMDSAEQTSEKAIGKTQETETESETTGKIEAGERTAVLTVVSITGNELTYYEEETETETKSESETSEDASSEDETEKLTEQTSGQGETRISKSGESETEEADGQISGQEDAFSDAQQSSNMPEVSQMPDGTPPDLSQDGTGPAPDFAQNGSESAPDMSQMLGGAAPDFSQNENDASGNTPSQMQRPDGAPGDFAQNAAGPATKTVYLPVPVVVHTDDGDRTFSILEAGDQLQATIVTDEDGNETITELWLLGTEDS